MGRFFEELLDQKYLLAEFLHWNSDIRIKGNYGAANRFTVVMWMN